jgi:hypothetical protein
LGRCFVAEFWEVRFSRPYLLSSLAVLKERFLLADILRFLVWEVSWMDYEALLMHF